MSAEKSLACEVCGEPVPPKGWRGGPKRRFCSKACGGKADAQRRKADEGRASRYRAYGRWRRMIARCQDPKNDHWHRYGGRGIYVCERWLDFDSYYADTGDAPDGMSLDRIDNDGPYAPDNVRWATPKQQRANQQYDPMRSKTHCKSGHPFDTENTHVDKRGWRTCRACARAKGARQRAAKKARAA